jgi:membrane associated rhomboid family serine protease
MRLSGRRASSHASHWSPPQKVVLFSLLAVNLAAFALQVVLEMSRPGLVTDYLGLSYRGIDQAYAWQFVTAMFLQSGVAAFVGCMLILFFVGRDMECILGQKHFLYLYCAGLVGGELGHLFFMPPATVLVGSAGGVAALVIAYATILPDLEVNGPLPFLPLKLKAKYLGWLFFGVAVCAIFVRRNGVIGHSAWLGGCLVGWVYARLLGFGQPLFIQRSLQRRRLALERKARMSVEDFIAEEIDPLLEKISRSGFASLSRSERRKLAHAPEKMADRPQ